MARRRTFGAIVSAAVRDLSEHGYDGEARVEFWVGQLREAAERDARSGAEMEVMLRRGMQAIWTKLVERGDLLRRHPGVARFTLERVRPNLRAELDRRMAASASLIRLNREEAINKTLQRFRGWATSIPTGGGPTGTTRAKEADNISKSLKALPFEERRVLVDQGHKLTGALSEVLAQGGHALAGVWHSHWRQTNYDYREDHKDRDELIYLLRGTWALEQGLVKPGPAGYYDTVTSVGQEPFCRCYMTWLYHVRDLPPAMLTRKGEAGLAAARAKIAGARMDAAA